MTPTRQLAVEALCKIFNKGIKPKEALDELSVDIDRRDRAFLMEVVYGVLRYRDCLDWMLKDFLKKPGRLSQNTLNNLRAAVYQLNYMRVPEWAVVDEAVNVERSHGGKPDLVNAVLRNFLRQRDKSVQLPEEKTVDYISITTSHPGWLIKRWIKRFGYDEALKLAEKNNEIPPLTIRMQNESEREQALQVLNEKGINAKPAKYSSAGVIIDSRFSFQELTDMLPYKYFVQDEASQLISYLLNPLPGERILDACAAPGGKATQMAQLMKDTGEITAVEIEKKKIELLKQNISRLGLRTITVVEGDIRGFTAVDLFDRILLDAPCSALGVIRRNPDVKYKHNGRDLMGFKAKQIELLQSVSGFLKPGGIMVYSVCSTEPDEGEEVIKKFLHDNHNFSIIKGDYGLFRQFEVTESDNVYYRTFPHRHDMDGFFAARLKKSGS